MQILLNLTYFLFTSGNFVENVHQNSIPVEFTEKNKKSKKLLRNPYRVFSDVPENIMFTSLLFIWYSINKNMRLNY